MVKKKRLLLVMIILIIFVTPLCYFTLKSFRIGGKVLLVSAQPDQGFFCDYYLFIPHHLETEEPLPLLVEINNKGGGFSHQEYIESAESIASFGASNYYAKQLKIPLLVPCFDRPGNLYTHALTKDSLLETQGTSGRVDLQLLAMIEDAREETAKHSITLREKVLMNGFSASASFANRFAFLHPDSVEAVAAGGLNGMPLLPAESYHDLNLTYPIGIYDLEALVGEPVLIDKVKSVPQFLYMGALDDNDTLPFSDVYDQEEQVDIVLAVLGESLAERFQKSEELYEQYGMNAT